MRTRVKIELIDVYPTSVGHCPHFNFVTAEFKCLGGEFQSDQLSEYPDHVADSHVRVAETVSRIKKALSGLPVSVTINLVGAQSITGVLKSFRHRLTKQFAVIVNGKKVWEGYPIGPAFENILRNQVASE